MPVLEEKPCNDAQEHSKMTKATDRIPYERTIDGSR